MIQDTSERAFVREVVPTLSERHQRVMEALEEGPATNTELASRLGWPINTVTPRVHELRKKGVVVEDGKRPCMVTGRTAYVWRINPGQQRLL